MKKVFVIVLLSMYFIGCQKSEPIQEKQPTQLEQFNEGFTKIVKGVSMLVDQYVFEVSWKLRNDVNVLLGQAAEQRDPCVTTTFDNSNITEQIYEVNYLAPCMVNGSNYDGTCKITSFGNFGTAGALIESFSPLNINGIGVESVTVLNTPSANVVNGNNEITFPINETFFTITDGDFSGTLYGNNGSVKYVDVSNDNTNPFGTNNDHQIININQAQVNLNRGDAYTVDIIGLKIDQFNSGGNYCPCGGSIKVSQNGIHIYTVTYSSCNTDAVVTYEDGSSPTNLNCQL